FRDIKRREQFFEGPFNISRRTPSPKRGVIIVFPAAKESAPYIKRLIGLPRDPLQMIGSLLYINGEGIKRERIDDFFCPEDSGRSHPVKRWRETLPSGISFDTLKLIDHGFYDDTKESVVPLRYCFVTGDNRDSSTDSRVPYIGFIPVSSVIG